MPRFITSRLKSRFERLQQSLPYAIAQRFVEIDILTHAASLTFFALLSLAPLLVLLLWLTASLYPAAQDALLVQIQGIAGSGAGEVASTVLENARTEPDVGSLAGVWSTLLLLFGATAVFARLQGTLNAIFHTAGDRLRGGLRAWLRKRVFSFGVVMALGFLLLVSAALTTVLEIAFGGSPTLPVLGNLAALALYAFAFALMYHYLPDRRVRWRQALLGGLLTAVLFVLGRWGIGLYIAEAAPGSAYGSMGTLVVLLVWLYYAAVVFFVGAMITAVIDERWRFGDVQRRLDARAARRGLPPVAELPSTSAAAGARQPERTAG
ncbi:YihY/virulence factor BrkB family protein [Luteimonas sp. MC1572]|uniref:YihY/virulence factor BrkB family protein n=1 Tax=Luteimonas sp. MC1572 TaxID=2799325 RepID=UPI0018F07A8D|nr:YihY/virulence factor BrkB family protein [Luteimonas sp. MC1572]MBJ6982137.1 YihY/virulence factor BrkB family protein [Luteimonas sp. MC1572]QQO03425.1 YihY/virulence factor BrkB family protein [Luteimonas sp. MC1572]